MRMYLISDNVDTHTGMRLSGVDGCVIHDEFALKTKLDSIAEDPTIGILFITEKIGRDFADEIMSFRQAHRTPLVVDIPDRHGTTKGENFLSAYTDSAMGIKK